MNLHLYKFSYKTIHSGPFERFLHAYEPFVHLYVFNRNEFPTLCMKFMSLFSYEIKHSLAKPKTFPCKSFFLKYIHMSY